MPPDRRTSRQTAPTYPQIKIGEKKRHKALKMASTGSRWQLIFLLMCFGTGTISMAKRRHISWGKEVLNTPSWGNRPIIHNYRTITRLPGVLEGSDDARAAEITQHSHYELEYILGRKIIFICVAKGNPRPRITWYKDGVELYAHNYFQVHEWKMGEDKIKSKMEIDPGTPMDVGYYECQANNEYAVDHRGFRTQYVASL